MKMLYPLLFRYIILMLVLCSFNVAAQDGKQMVRLARLVIEQDQLENYRTLLKEEIENSVQRETGVLTLYAVSEKKDPTHFTILEIYADSKAYNDHVQTPHFIKYKEGTKGMVKSLELVEVVPLLPGMEIK